MWHITCDTWHMTHDRWEEVNLLSKVQLPSSYGLAVRGDMWHLTCHTWHVHHAILKFYSQWKVHSWFFFYSSVSSIVELLQSSASCRVVFLLFSISWRGVRLLRSVPCIVASFLWIVWCTVCCMFTIQCTANSLLIVVAKHWCIWPFVWGVSCHEPIVSVCSLWQKHYNFNKNTLTMTRLFSLCQKKNIIVMKRTLS